MEATLMGMDEVPPVQLKMDIHALEVHRQQLTHVHRFEEMLRELAVNSETTVIPQMRMVEIFLAKLKQAGLDLGEIQPPKTPALKFEEMAFSII
jgi:hypothetical protein